MAKPVASVISVLLVLACGAIISTLFLLEHAGSITERSIERQTAPGTHAYPLTIAEGERFDINELSYLAGWDLDDASESWSLTGLRVTNHGSSPASLSVLVKGWRRSDLVATIECTASNVPPATTGDVACSTQVSAAIGPDHLTVQNTY